MIRHQDVSVVRILDVLLVRLHDVSCKSQKLNNVAVVHIHPVSELRCCDALLIGLYYVFKLICHYLHLVGFHVSFLSIKSITKFSSTNNEGNKKSRIIN